MSKKKGTVIAESNPATDKQVETIIAATATPRQGRPVVAGSERQQKIAAQEAKKAMFGGVLPLGRQANPESKRQQELQAKAAKVASGVEVKKGRPAGTGMTPEQKAERAAIVAAAVAARQQNDVVNVTVEAPAKTEVTTEVKYKQTA